MSLTGSELVESGRIRVEGVCAYARMYVRVFQKVFPMWVNEGGSLSLSAPDINLLGLACEGRRHSLICSVAKD